MYRMQNLVEILLAILLILLVIGEPKFLIKMSKSLLGKLLFVIAVIAAGMQSFAAGVLVFLIFITLRNDSKVIEGMENETDQESDSETDSETDEESDSEDVNSHSKVVDGVDMSKTEFVTKYCKEGKLDASLNPPVLKYKNQKCNPCDEGCDFEVTSAHEQLTIDEAMRPKESNSIPVSKE